MIRAVQNLWSLWSAFLGSPRRVGAVIPSSSALARRMVADVDWKRVQTVVECGPGTGAFTGGILRLLEPGSRFLAVEIDPVLADRLRVRHPGASVHSGSICDLPAILRREQLEPADLVVSGLPWASFSVRDQEELLAAVVDSMAPHGRLHTYAYAQGVWLPSGRRFRELLGTRFRRVTRSPMVWRNVPPAFVYRCER